MTVEAQHLRSATTMMADAIGAYVQGGMPSDQALAEVSQVDFDATMDVSVALAGRYPEVFAAMIAFATAPSDSPMEEAALRVASSSLTALVMHAVCVGAKAQRLADLDALPDDGQ